MAQWGIRLYVWVFCFVGVFLFVFPVCFMLCLYVTLLRKTKPATSEFLLTGQDKFNKWNKIHTSVQGSNWVSNYTTTVPTSRAGSSPTVYSLATPAQLTQNHRLLLCPFRWSSRSKDRVISHMAQSLIPQAPLKLKNTHFFMLPFPWVEIKRLSPC